LALTETLQKDMMSALKAGEKLRLGALRLALAAIRQQEVDTRLPVPDDDAFSLLEKLIKRGREAEQQFQAGGRPEQAAQEAAEIAVFQEYLPERLGTAELDAVISEVVAATGASGIQDMGKVMAALKQRSSGRIDMAAANRLVREVLS
jgi:uncharacterized protein YqeY